jgi:hypothetical protein
MQVNQTESQNSALFIILFLFNFRQFACKVTFFLPYFQIFMLSVAGIATRCSFHRLGGDINPIARARSLATEGTQEIL